MMVMMMVVMVTAGLGRHMQARVIVFFRHGFFSDSAMDNSLFTI
jgi:hypothetical protein